MKTGAALLLDREIRAAALNGTAHLQRPVGHAQTHCRTLQIAFFLLHDEADRGVSGDVADVPQSQPQRNGIADRVLERLIAPTCRPVAANRTVPFRNIAGRDGSLARMAMGEARDPLPKVTDITGIVAAEQIVTANVVEDRRFTPRCHLFKE